MQTFQSDSYPAAVSLNNVPSEWVVFIIAWGDGVVKGGGMKMEIARRGGMLRRRGTPSGATWGDSAAEGNSLSLRQLPHEGAMYHETHVVGVFSAAAGGALRGEMLRRRATPSAFGSTRPTRPPRGSHVP